MQIILVYRHIEGLEIFKRDNKVSFKSMDCKSGLNGFQNGKIVPFKDQRLSARGM